MKHLLSIVMFLFCISSFSNLSAQITSLSASSELIFSDIKSNLNTDLETFNTWKYSLGFRIGADYNLWNNKLLLKTSLSYNERKALEFFSFPSLTYVNVPTSPQSEGFYDGFVNFIHFPNFKYLHLDLLPVLSLGKKLTYVFGVGISAGALLNQKRVTFGKEHFSWSVTDSEDPFYISGKIRYHKYDARIVAYAGINYPIKKDKYKLGISARYYESFLRLNDSFEDSDVLLTKWVLFTGSLNFTYMINGTK